MQNYRKVWIDHNGPIPKDSSGRSYEIHHLNGDHLDNRIENLALVTIDQHYKIHYDQGDYRACQLIAFRWKEISTDEISRLSSLLANKRVKEKSHNFLDGALQRQTQKKRMSAGIHNYLGENHPSKIRLSCRYCKYYTNLTSLNLHIKKHHNEPI